MSERAVIRTVIFVMMVCASMGLAGLAIRDRDAALLRQRADAIAFPQVLDSTRTSDGILGAAGIVGGTFTVSENSIAPRYIIDSWMPPLTEGAIQVSAAHWACPPGHKLQFDGQVPYCQRAKVVKP